MTRLDSLRIAVCVDDTDDLTKVTSTGKVADDLAHEVVRVGGTVELGITRHQLPLLENIKYTSHNSSMCFTATLPNKDAFYEFFTSAGDIVVKGSVPDADPGLCIFRFPPAQYQKQVLHDLIAYGLFAKEHYVPKETAYRVAAGIEGLWLKEFGGTGIGVIGALAGVALRLTGCDGRFRGKVTRDLLGIQGEGRLVPSTVGEVVAALGSAQVAQICDEDQVDLPADTAVLVPQEIKLLLLYFKKTLIARPVLDNENDGALAYEIFDRHELRQTFDVLPRWYATCENFAWDNDIEEMVDDDLRLCSSCLYRRWTQTGVLCSAGHTAVPVKEATVAKRIQQGH